MKCGESHEKPQNWIKIMHHVLPSCWNFQILHPMKRILNLFSRLGGWYQHFWVRPLWIRGNQSQCHDGELIVAAEKCYVYTIIYKENADQSFVSLVYFRGEHSYSMPIFPRNLSTVTLKAPLKVMLKAYLIDITVWLTPFRTELGTWITQYRRPSYSKCCFLGPTYPTLGETS